MVGTEPLDGASDGLKARFVGAMLGTAVGDCLGRPVEGHSNVSPAYLDEVVTDPPPLYYTDDTAMTFAVAESLLASGGFSGSDLATRFVAEYEAGPHRGYGAGVVTVFDRVARGIPWEEAARRQFGGQGSYGNGAAMRVTPVALWGYPDVDQVAALAADTARVTHTHPVGVDGAVVQALAVLHALSAPRGRPIDFEEFATGVGGRITSEAVASQLETLGQALERRDDEWAVLHLGNGVAADRSVLTAFYCFARSDSFEDTILRALRMGGDTDTIASMAAAIAGARYGETAIPIRWRDVEASERILAAADALFARHQRPPSSSGKP
jgi:poly(ADP-ribose) glycohydrolase ARH3